MSGLLLTLLLLGMLTLASSIQPVKASGTIYIRPNGRVEPKGTPISSVDKITYTFTGNIYDQIVVERDNIVIDGAGYTLRGTLALHTKGIDLSYRSNVAIRNTEIKAFWYGVWLDHSSYNSIAGNNITGNSDYGIHLQLSSNNNISGNTVAYHPCGIALLQSSGNTISGNNASNNGRSNISLEASSNNNTVCGNTVKGAYKGVGIHSSSYNNITGNIISYNYPYGMSLSGSSYNSVTGNIISYNDPYGIFLMGSACMHNSISENTVTNGHEFGIYLNSACYNNVSENTVEDNWFGIYLYAREFEPPSSNNVFYHNNFMKNRHHVHDYSWEEPDVPPAINTWDDGYPSGGNYWSDYTGVDVKSGPNQDQPSSDSLGDTPYVIDPNNQDNYPLMYPWGAPLPPAHTLTIDSSPTGITFTIDDVSRTTPWSGTYIEGTSVSLEMPQTHDGYVWSHWLEDRDTNKIKTVVMDTNIVLTGVFAYTFDVIIDDTHYPVSILSNSTVSNFNFGQTEMQISFDVNGESGSTGYCNVTIPKSLLNGDPWIIQIDDTPVTDFDEKTNDTHTFLYFTYTHENPLQATIGGTWVVPEFPSFIILPLFMFLALIAVALAKKIQRVRKNACLHA